MANVEEIENKNSLLFSNDIIDKIINSIDSISAVFLEITNGINGRKKIK